MLVPLRLRYGCSGTATVPLSRYGDIETYIELAGVTSDSMPTPGATRSGFARRSTAVGPRELNAAMVSSLRSIVPMWLDAPTVSTQGAFPGAVMPPYWVDPCRPRPALPADATTTIPRSTTLLAATVSGSRLYDSYTPVATDRFAT